MHLTDSHAQSYAYKLTKRYASDSLEKLAGERTLVIWRTLCADASANTEFAAIYRNGSHTLADPHNKIHLIEKTFHLRMFVDQEVGL